MIISSTGVNAPGYSYLHCGVFGSDFARRNGGAGAPSVSPDGERYE